MAVRGSVVLVVVLVVVVVVTDSHSHFSYPFVYSPTGSFPPLTPRRNLRHLSFFFPPYFNGLFFPGVAS